MSDPSPIARSYAEDIVHLARQSEGVDLDYTAESLQYIDQILEGFRHQGLSRQDLEQALIGLGCYLGEVIIKTIGGRWRRGAEVPGFSETPVVVELAPGRVFNPIGRVVKRLENGAIDSIAYFYAVVKQTMHT